METTLKDLAVWLESNGALFNERAARKAERCDGEGPFAAFGPCRCVDCEPEAVAS